MTQLLGKRKLTKIDAINMENFLQLSDYKKQIRQSVLKVLTDEDDNTLHDAELTAQEEMEGYLNKRFDVGKIFSLDQEVSDRKRVIVMYLIDLTLYHLHSNITPNNIPEIRYLRYERALKWLDKVLDGKITPDLPLIESDEPFPNGGSQFFYGDSNEKVTERY